jgi:signal recognition particle receptor subunit beta
MDSVRSERPSAEPRVPVALKILIAGGFGAGKTTMVGSVSEIKPLQTEEVLTGAPGSDDISGIEGKRTTTVTMDFGRITLNEDLQLYLFGTPGQDRFWFLWDELSQGTPFVVAVNCFDSQQRFAPDAVRRALDLDPQVPVVFCDARDRVSARNVLIDLVEYVARRQLSMAGTPPLS